ncbi:SDR family NAD(P)-dependent oxidoreductase [Microbacterium ureisolvens]|uniref:SDR family oxidoreductase n=1 Tax=Microbacterium ureisolvens TaxID=2781186 RepID=A0ABS7I0L6_9MICO|nr:SDR family oxidoreductase [Microbacterium ureisolvens]MBW9110342.1 SDR family oxidoreductase [Microbacterium ureisolvens]
MSRRDLAGPFLVLGGTALITGASSGLGAEFARQLGARNVNLVLVARRAGRLEQLAHDVRADSGVEVTCIDLDLIPRDAAESLHAELARRGIAVDLLVNNAGFGTLGDVVDTDPATLDDVIALNVTALTALSRRFGGDMVASRRGAVVNVASLTALLPAPHMAVYGATKAYVQSFTQALDAEFRPHGVAALTVLPGPTRTEFFDRSGGKVGPDSAYLTPAVVVSATLRALDRSRPPLVVVPGRGNAFSAPLLGRMPRRLGLSLSERMMRIGLDMAAKDAATAADGSSRRRQ